MAHAHAHAWCVQVEAALEALLKKVLKAASKKGKKAAGNMLTEAEREAIADVRRLLSQPVAGGGQGGVRGAVVRGAVLQV